MRVSVVIPAYREARWIGACLESLAGQAHEVIVVDDGSPDDTGAIAAAHGARVIRTAHRGTGAARDTGGRAATGDVLAFLDADELYATDFVERLTAPLDHATGTFPGTITWHNAGAGLAPGWLTVRGVRGAALPDYGATHPFPKALRRDRFLDAGGYPHVGHGEDLAFGARVGAAVVVPDAAFAFTLPEQPLEVLRKARWIARGVRFPVERPPLHQLLPPVSLVRAARLAAGGRHRAAVVRVLYDAGLLLGAADRLIAPGSTAAP